MHAATVVTRLLGGLGNQMFQYAAARALALRLGSELLLDTRALQVDGPHTRRDYALDAFDIRARVAAAAELSHLADRPALAEAGPRHDARLETLREPAYLAGYWQCERYFRAIRPVLQRDFRLRRPVAEAVRAAAQRLAAAVAAHARGSGPAPVALHVRRGDYVSLPQAVAHHGTCGADYYLRALQWLQRRHGALEVHAYSDDPAWVRDELFPRLTHGPGGLGQACRLHLASSGGQAAPPHDELWLMQQARHYVIANSSFSWWAAWLGSRPGSDVVAPAHWVRTSGFDTRDVVPAGWMRL